MHHAAPPSADPVEAALAVARGLLPDQGPIGVFIHHNTLHALQHRPFHEAVVEGARVTGARPYLSLDEYRAAHARGRVDARDIDDALERMVGDPDRLVAFGLTRIELRRLLLLHDPARPDVDGTRFRATHARDGGRARRRWEAALTAVARAPRRSGEPRPLYRHHDAFIAHGHAGTDAVIHRELIRLCAGFVDQGQALVPMPGRRSGFLRAVAALYATAPSDPRLAPGLAASFGTVMSQQIDARAVIQRVLESLGVDADARHDFILHTLLALPGWAGMFSRLEAHPEEALEGIPVRLADFLAVRLLIEECAIIHTASELAAPVTFNALRASVPPEAAESVESLAVRLDALAAGAGWSDERLAAVTADDLAHLQQEQHDWPDVARRATWHEAYEGWYRRHVLDAVAARRALGPRRRPRRPDAQFIFCIDEREESIRRAIEEQGAGLETFGAAGFFGVAIDFRGLYDVEAAAHCPVVVVPDHEVHEAPLLSAEGWDAARRRMRDTWHVMHRGAHRRSRTLLGGIVLSLTLGPAAAAVALARVFLPRLSLGWFLRLRDRYLPRPATRLAALRPDEGERGARGKWIGFTLQESTDRVAGTLRGIGLTKDFAPIVVVLGHGSTSLNNPHESAHDCGACGGRRGGANARLFADMANRAEVREALRARGIDIPSTTWFVGGLHDTSDDGVHYSDLDLMPRDLQPAFARADQVLEVARKRSAQERCRRFDHAPLGISPDDALAHVEARASHLGQPRPEYGHCTNASAFVGRREISRGIHFDRRAFLISYDPSIDPDHAIIERILAAVGPVGAGISLEYYFSSVDNEVYGCGTKLPHNVTGLVGIMNGHHSDLRTGLPLQMVEIHEPMRLLLIVEATPEALLHVAGRQAEVRELVVMEWVQLVSVHPETGAMMVFQGGTFVPYEPGRAPIPIVNSSIEWHGRSRDHLAPALTLASLDLAETPAEHRAA